MGFLQTIISNLFIGLQLWSCNIIDYVCIELLLLALSFEMKRFSVEQHQRRRRVLWFSTGTTCRPPNSPVLRRIRLRHRRQRRRDSRCAAEHGPAADARDALCALAGTNQSGIVHVRRRSPAVPSFRSQLQSSHVSEKHRLSHRLQGRRKCQPVGCRLRVTRKFRHQRRLFTSKLRLFSVFLSSFGHFYLASLSGNKGGIQQQQQDSLFSTVILQNKRKSVLSKQLQQWMIVFHHRKWYHVWCSNVCSGRCALEQFQKDHSMLALQFSSMNICLLNL